MSLRPSSESGPHSGISLAQRLYEASPASGWSGPWHTLADMQRHWWEEFASLARTYVNMEQEEDPSPVNSSPSHAPARPAPTLNGKNQ